MGGSIRLGKILGITVQVHYTWFVALWALSFSLARGVFPEQIPGQPPETYWTMGVVGAVLLFTSVLVHELGHALVARLYQIPTRSITLFLFGGVAHIAREPERPTHEFSVAIAGPVTSLGLAGIFWALTPRGEPVPATALMGYLAWANLLLAAFNMLPAFPLDGGRVLRAVLWAFYGYERATRIVTLLGQVTAGAFILLGVVGVFTGRVLNGLWLILIGWFLEQAASASYQQAVLRRILGGIRVADIMTREVRVMPAELTLEEAVHDYFLPHKHGGYPVVYGDRLVGILTLHDLRRVPRERWRTARVREVMTPIAQAKAVRPDLSAYEALARMLQDGVGRLLVLDEGGELVGLVTRSDLMHLIRVRTELGGE
ncbi:MAG: site-2 protease family protein [Armatimonadota bacterium]|nr:site-2 protease family protein [Armatimonadota bacterium]MDR7569503.1 site-2 protease family protein [Armatimonadota bacterium]MDR7613535.1 site-2 protease family protein [Armatimonadota bacterium]